MLREGGWKVNEESGLWEKKLGGESIPLAFSISTGNAPVFVKTAEALKARWEELGARVTIKQFEQSDLVQGVIRPRRYETLLFGSEVGRELDVYPFWHSSQRNDPGLNVALYANIAADALLTATRADGDGEERTVLYQKLMSEIAKDAPAVFLFTPSYTYAVAPEVQNISLTGSAKGSERFAGIRQWYTETDAVWSFFANE